MRCGLGSASITNFDDDVDGFECFGELAFGFGDVAGIPVYFWAEVAGGERGVLLGVDGGGYETFGPSMVMIVAIMTIMMSGYSSV